jgi:adenosylhomocysteine nucleosidase
MQPLSPVRILICFATEAEAAPLRRDRPPGTTVRMVITGIGRMNAMRSVERALREHSPDIVLSSGFAGGLDPALPRNALVAATDDEGLRRVMTAEGARLVAFECSGRIAITTAEKAALRRATLADAVEMESEAIHALCRANGVRCATARIISDAASEDLPLDFNRLTRRDHGIHYGKLALALARSPRKLGELLAFKRRVDAAALDLGRFLARVINRLSAGEPA